ncbi:AAA ATPase [Dinochytrium kinnereticum]|nr:AAA ATPase [Dinochytrium kinnereticum]
MQLRSSPGTPSKRLLRSSSTQNVTTPVKKKKPSLAFVKGGSIEKKRTTRSSASTPSSNKENKENDENDENDEDDLPNPALLKTPVSERRHPKAGLFEGDAFRTPSSFSEGAEPLTVYRSAKNVFKPSCTPTKLIGREKERTTILDFLKETVVADTPGSLYISGSPGTGKTALVGEILNTLRKEFPSVDKSGVKILTINCMELKDPNQIYERILEGFGGSAGPDDDVYAEMLNVVCHTSYNKSGKGNLRAMRVLVLDEIDHLITHDQGTLYKLFEIPAMEGSKLVLIGIANALDLLHRSLPHLEKKNCLPKLLNFLPYNVSEISEIIKGRLRDVEAIIERSSPMSLDEESPQKSKPSLPLMHPSAIELCARKVSSSGDLRRALDVCRQSMEIMESEALINSNPLMKTPTAPCKSKPKTSSPLAAFKSIHDMPKVSVSHILKATASVTGSGPVQRIAGLSTQQKAILLSLVLMIRKDPRSNMAIGNLHDSYLRICKESKLITPVTRSEFRDVISLLETSGLIVLHKAKEERDRRVELSVLPGQVEMGIKGDPLLSDLFRSMLSDMR